MQQAVNETTTVPVESKPKSAPSKSLDSQMARVAELLAGIQAHTELLSKRGIDTAFITQFSTDYQGLIDAHNAQLAFKARMMEKTEELQAKLSRIQASYSEARNQVKRTFPKATWREFGITDQRI